MQDNYIQMYLKSNEGKSFLKAKIYMHMTAVSKNVCINKLDEIVNKYKHIYKRNIKMKPADVKVNAYWVQC